METEIEIGTKMYVRSTDGGDIAQYTYCESAGYYLRGPDLIFMTLWDREKYWQNLIDSKKQQTER